MVNIPLFLEIQTGRTNSGFPYNFLGGYLFVFAELCNRSPKMRTKNYKSYISILVIVNFRNWMDVSPPLMVLNQ